MTLLIARVLPSSFLPSIIPENVLYLYSWVFKGVHLKRAISSEEQWTRELLKHEKFHSGKLSTIEWVVMSNHMYMVFAVPFKKKFLNRLLKNDSLQKDKYSFCKNIYTFVFNIFFAKVHIYSQNVHCRNTHYFVIDLTRYSD